MTRSTSGKSGRRRRRRPRKTERRKTGTTTTHYTAEVVTHFPQDLDSWKPKKVHSSNIFYSTQSSKCLLFQNRCFVFVFSVPEHWAIEHHILLQQLARFPTILTNITPAEGGFLSKNFRGGGGVKKRCVPDLSITFLLPIKNQEKTTSSG